MTVRLDALVVEASSPAQVARFWAHLLAWTDAGGGALTPTDGTGFALRFVGSDRPKTAKNRMHLDLTSRSPADQRQTVAMALALGARHVDVGQGPDETHVVLADPEGNEFCVIAAGNAFLDGCGFVGALACDGSRDVGLFWSAALGWPLVWDQDEETAIRSPAGGPKITWGGEHPPSGHRHDRVRFALSGNRADLDRLLSLGATRSDRSASDAKISMLDPDGTGFTLRLGG